MNEQKPMTLAQARAEIDPTPFQLTDGDQSPDAGNMVDGVEWETIVEETYVNEMTIVVQHRPSRRGVFDWIVSQDGRVLARSNPLSPPATREEARRQAIEAARGMG